jgi:DNA-binding IclR family transcriptional regulator
VTTASLRQHILDLLSTRRGVGAGSVEALSAILGEPVQSVREAVAELERDGLVERPPGAPFFLKAVTRH